jgi:hypothetical protein
LRSYRCSTRTEKKDRDLKLKEKNIQLLTEQGKLQRQKLAQAQMVRNGTIAGAVMLVLLLGTGLQPLPAQAAKQPAAGGQAGGDQPEKPIPGTGGAGKRGVAAGERMDAQGNPPPVRNNLQIVISLLNSQAADLADDTALSTIKRASTGCRPWPSSTRSSTRPNAWPASKWLPTSTTWSFICAIPTTRRGPSA